MMTVLAIAALKHHIHMHLRTHTHTHTVGAQFHITLSIWLDVQQRHDIYYCSVCLAQRHTEHTEPCSVQESRLSLDQIDHSLSPMAQGVPQ